MDEMLNAPPREVGEDYVFKYQKNRGATLATYKTTCDIQTVDNDRLAKLIADVFQALKEMDVPKGDIKKIISPLMDAFESD